MDEKDMSLSQTFVVRPGEQFYFALSNDHGQEPACLCLGALQSTMNYWRGWAEKCTLQGPYRDMGVRSALILQLMTYPPSGAIVSCADDLATGDDRGRDELGLSVHMAPGRPYTFAKLW